MPKSSKPPKYSKMGKYAVVYVHCKPRYLGLYGSGESKIAYSRFLAELQSSPSVPMLDVEKHVTVRELTAAFLDYAVVNFDYKDYSHSRIIVLDFLDKLYGDNTSADGFKPRYLKLVREQMIQSRRFCRRIVNRYTQRIIAIFQWGVENELVLETTWRALKAVKSLPEGYPGTFDNEERQPVPDPLYPTRCRVEYNVNHNERKENVMSAQPLTYEAVLDLFRLSDERFDKRMEEAEAERQELREAVKKTTEAVERTNEAVGSLSNRVGEMVEKLVGEGNLVDQFRELGHNVKTHSRHKVFGKKGTAESGEIDLFLEDGDVAILVEAKTTLKMDHVKKHIERLEKYRRFVDTGGNNGKRYIGAVAGTVIAENVINFAHENGMYVIIQSARAVEILAQPEGFKAKEW